MRNTKSPAEGNRKLFLILIKRIMVFSWLLEICKETLFLSSWMQQRNARFILNNWSFLFQES
jgi:hypothetical protein